MNLPADNLYEFIDGEKRFYRVDDISPYKVGDRVTLYNDDDRHDFVVADVNNWSGPILTLVAVRFYEAEMRE